VRGLNTHATDAGGGLVVADPNDPNSPDRTFDLKKISHLCKATQVTAVPGGAAEGPVDSRARLLCYKMKASRSHCLPTAPTNALGACRKEEECGGNDLTTLCVPQAKFDSKDTDLHGLYLNDAFDVVAGSAPSQPTDYHRLDLNKEDMICVPGCENPDEAIQFSPHVLRVTSLTLPPTGHPGDGIDLDMNPLTCAPTGDCSGGVDNFLGLLSSLVPDINTSIAAALSSGDIHIILEIDDLADGNQLVNGYQGELDDGDPGCSSVNSGAEVCNYVVSGVDLDTRTCDKQADINFPVTISGLPASPAAVNGGGPQSSFTIAVPVLGIELALTVRNVQLVSSVVHSGGVVQSATGILGGAIIHRQLKQTINSLPPGLCIGGANDNEPCAVLADCPDSGVGTQCDTDYLGGVPLPVIAGFVDSLPRDIDTDGQLTCEGGLNNGEACAVPAECPDPSTAGPGNPVACEANDATSIGLTFAGIDAAISGAETECTLATCSLE
jgi:hypothetical protein